MSVHACRVPVWTIHFRRVWVCRRCGAVWLRHEGVDVEYNARTLTWVRA